MNQWGDIFHHCVLCPTYTMYIVQRGAFNRLYQFPCSIEHLLVCWHYHQWTRPKQMLQSSLLVCVCVFVWVWDGMESKWKWRIKWNRVRIISNQITGTTWAQCCGNIYFLVRIAISLVVIDHHWRPPSSIMIFNSPLSLPLSHSFI